MEESIKLLLLKETFPGNSGVKASENSKKKLLNVKMKVITAEDPSLVANERHRFSKSF